MKMEDRKNNLDLNAGSLNLTKKTEDMRLTLRKKRVNEMLINLMEKKYDQVRISDQLATKLEDLNLPDDVKFKTFTDDSDFICFLNFLFESPSVDYKKFGLNILKLNLNSKFYDPNVMKIDTSLINKAIENMQKHSDDLNFVFETITFLTSFCSIIMNDNIIECIFTNENNLIVMKEIFNNKNLINIPDIMNIFVLFTLNLILKNNEKIAIELKKIGFIDKMVSIIDETKIHINILINTLDLILTITKNKFQILDSEQLQNIVKKCLMFALSNDSSVRVPCYWIISYLSELESKAIIDELVKSDFIQFICKEYSMEPETILPVIRILGNISGNEDYYVTYLMKNEVFNFFRKTLPIENNEIRKELYWTFSNFSATCREAVNKFLDDDIIIPMSKGLLYSTVFFLKEEILYFFANLISNADFLITKKLLDWKIDEDMILLLKETKNPDLLNMVFGIINELIDLPIFIKKETKGADGLNRERTLDNSRLIKYSKNKSPFIDSLVKKGILEVLDKLTTHNNNDVAGHAEDIIFKLKDDF